MRPVNIVLLVLAGAIGGAVVMKVAQRPHPAAVAEVRPVKPAAPVPTAAPAPEPLVPTPAVEPPAAATTQPVEATPAQPQPVEAKPSPMRRKAMVRPKQVEFQHPAERRTAPRNLAGSGVPVNNAPQGTPVPPPAPVETAKVEPSLQAPVSTPPLTPEQPKETPPARMEPEDATPAPAPIPPAPDPHTVTLNAGMLVPVRLVDSLSLERNHVGDRFTATLYRELAADGFVIAERGARVEGRVVTADRSGRILGIELTDVELSDNQNVAIQTERFDKHGEPDHSQAAAKVGAGAVIGAVIGGIAGGGKGAAIGAGVGGGAGAGDVLLTRRPVTLPSETTITFRLRAPVTITERRN